MCAIYLDPNKKQVKKVPTFSGQCKNMLSDAVQCCLATNMMNFVQLQDLNGWMHYQLNKIIIAILKSLLHTVGSHCSYNSQLCIIKSFTMAIQLSTRLGDRLTVPRSSNITITYIPHIFKCQEITVTLNPSKSAIQNQIHLIYLTPTQYVPATKLSRVPNDISILKTESEIKAGLNKPSRQIHLTFT